PADVAAGLRRGARDGGCRGVRGRGRGAAARADVRRSRRGLCAPSQRPPWLLLLPRPARLMAASRTTAGLDPASGGLLAGGPDPEAPWIPARTPTCSTPPRSCRCAATARWPWPATAR